MHSINEKYPGAALGEEEEEEEEFIEDRTSARRDSEQGGTVGPTREKEEVMKRRRRRSLLRIVHARGAIPNEVFITSGKWRGKHNSLEAVIKAKFLTGAAHRRLRAGPP